MGNDFYHSCKRCNGSGTEHTWSPEMNDIARGSGGIIACRKCGGSGLDWSSPKRRDDPNEKSGKKKLGDSSGESRGGRFLSLVFACLIIFIAVFGLAMWLAEFLYGNTKSKDLPTWFMGAGLVAPFVVMALGRKHLGITAILCVLVAVAALFFG